MHTISESGFTGDVDAAIHAVFETLRHMDGMHGGEGIRRSDLSDGHPRLETARQLTHRPAPQEAEEKDH